MHLKNLLIGFAIICFATPSVAQISLRTRELDCSWLGLEYSRRKYRWETREEPASNWRFFQAPLKLLKPALDFIGGQDEETSSLPPRHTVLISLATEDLSRIASSKGCNDLAKRIIQDFKDNNIPAEVPQFKSRISDE